jgi:hypothetical protein
MNISAQIEQLDPERDHQRIVHLLCCYEFPFDITRSLEFALFRTLCVPRTAALLDHTGEFGERAQKRYDDTDILISEFMEWGYESPRGAAALARMNHIHACFRIANEDFLYVFSTFVYEPIRWNARFGWRRMSENERMALFHFWREVGRRMGIQGIPQSYDEFERFNVEYECIRFRYSAASHRIGTATREMFCRWFPRPLHPLVRSTIHALLDDEVIAAFGFPRPSRFMRYVVPAALRLRGRIVRWLPARKRPRLRSEMRHRSYPQRCPIAEIGPPEQRRGKTEVSPI